MLKIEDYQLFLNLYKSSQSKFFELVNNINDENTIINIISILKMNTKVSDKEILLISKKINTIENKYNILLFLDDPLESEFDLSDMEIDKMLDMYALNDNHNQKIFLKLINHTNNQDILHKVINMMENQNFSSDIIENIYHRVNDINYKYKIIININDFSSSKIKLNENEINDIIKLISEDNKIDPYKRGLCLIELINSYEEEKRIDIINTLNDNYTSLKLDMLKKFKNDQNILKVLEKIKTIPEGYEIENYSIIKIILTNYSTIHLFIPILEKVNKEIKDNICEDFKRIFSLLKIEENKKNIFFSINEIKSLEIDTIYEKVRNNNPKVYLLSNVGEELKRGLIKKEDNIESIKNKILISIFDNIPKKFILEQIYNSNYPNIFQINERLLYKMGLSNSNKTFELDELLKTKLIDNNIENIGDIEFKFKEIIKNVLNQCIDEYLLNPIEESNNTKILNQMIIFALNCQKVSFERLIMPSIENKIKLNLKLTDEALDTIIKRKKMKTFLNNEKQFINKIGIENIAIKLLNINLVSSIEEANNLIKELCNKSLNTKRRKELSKIQNVILSMNNDIIKITEKNITDLPLNIKNFDLCSEYQKKLFIKSIVTYVSSMNDFTLINYSIKSIVNGMEDRINNSKFKSLELLVDILPVLCSKQISKFEVNYLKIKNKLKKLGHNYELNNANSLKRYFFESEKLCELNDEKKALLGSVASNLLSNNINENASYFASKMSGLCYSFVPNINIKVGNIICKSYEVDDPKQLVSGVRITNSDSCFRIDGVQGETFKYVTSNPNGKIFEFSDEKGNFLGRVYGYRIGNSFNMTRIFNDKEFDYEEVMNSLSNKIISESKDEFGNPSIEYVTSIPMSLNKKFKNKIAFSNVECFTKTEEGNHLLTDHYVGGITLMATSNSNIDMKKINKGDNLEFEKVINKINNKSKKAKYYKNKRKIIEGIDKKNIEYALHISSIVSFKNNNEEFIEINEENISRLITGNGWFILINKNGNVKIQIQTYNDEIYNKLITNELKENIIKLKNESTCLNTEKTELLI